MVCERITNLIRINKSTNINESKYLTDDLTIDWDALNLLLSDSEEVLENYEDCLRCKLLINPVLIECQKILTDQTKFRKNLEEFSSWTHSTSEILDVFDEICIGQEDKTIEAILRTTLLIEFALGNVYKTLTGRLPPHLFKELLQELADLENVFEPNQIFILQLIIGTANGVNLRNFVWHGFTETVDPAYACFLLVIVASYGKQLQRHLILSRLRNDVDLTSIVLETELDLDHFIVSPTVKQNNFKSWQRIVKCYSEGNFKPVVFLLLCQTESLLRLIYGQVNQINVNAKLGKYYVILDSIFYEYILEDDYSPLIIGKISRKQELVFSRTKKRNKMLELFPSSLINLGFDLFQAVDGPRIRDKISHGESMVRDEDAKQVTEKLLKFATLVAQFNDQRQLANFNYKSVYMNNFKFVKKYNEVCQLLQETFSNLLVPETLQHESNNFNLNLHPTNDEDVRNFFRPFSEAQTVKLMLNILENVDVAMNNFSITCKEFFKLYLERKLGTSRRHSLRHLIASLPNFHEGFQSLMNEIAEIFSTIQLMNVDNEDESFCQNSVKFLKLSLKFTENIAKNFSLDGRNFFVANEKTCEFLQLTDNRKHLFKR